MPCHIAFSGLSTIDSIYMMQMSHKRKKEISCVVEVTLSLMAVILNNKKHYLDGGFELMSS